MKKETPSKKQAQQEERTESFAAPRTMPGGWDLSALPARRQAESKENPSQPTPSTQPSEEATEVKFSEWQLEWDYFDQVVPPERRSLSAY